MPTLVNPNNRRFLIAIVIALLCANLLVIGSAAFSLTESKRLYEEHARTLTQNVASSLEQSVVSSVNRIELALHGVADELERQLRTGKLSPEAVASLITRYETRLPELEAIRISDATGLVLFGKGISKSAPVTWSDRDYFIQHRQLDDGKLNIGKPRIGRAAKQYIVHFSLRYNDPAGRFAGVISAPVAVSYFSDLLKQYPLPEDSTLILRDQDLGLIARFPPITDKPAGQIGNAQVSAEFQSLIQSGQANATYHIFNSPDGYERTLSFRRLANIPMIALVGVSAAQYMSGWRAELHQTIAMVFAFFVSSFGLGIALLVKWQRENEVRYKLARSEQQLRTIIEAEPECIKVISAEGNLLQMNAAGLAMVEANSFDQVRNQKVFGLIAPEYRDAYSDLHRRVISGEAVQQEFEVIGLKGGRRVLETHAVPIHEDDRVLHLAVTRDITERKAGEIALKKALAAAESANVAKSQFLATMSHEIRTPMNGILGMAQMLLMSDVDKEERQDFARTILNSGETLLTLLNDILDFSKIEAGKLELEMSVIDPAQILNETVNLFRENAFEKGLAIEAVCEGVSKNYLADPHRIRQMLSNLTNNAIKFTSSGQVTLKAIELERQGETALIEFSVRDTGVGIAEDKLSLLFLPFSQVDGSISRQFGGTGLGLSIVRSLAEKMGGHAGVESLPGQGSRFWFQIRAEVVDIGVDRRNSERGLQESGISSQPLKGNVLVVEDNPVNQKVIQALLGKLGLGCYLASDGKLGLQAVQAGPSIDLILMDVNMPIMGGYEATQRIRSWEADSQRHRLPIIALTADAFDEDRKRCFDSGMDDFLAKPVNIKQLTRVLHRWLPIVDESPDLS